MEGTNPPGVRNVCGLCKMIYVIIYVLKIILTSIIFKRFLYITHTTMEIIIPVSKTKINIKLCGLLSLLSLN